MPESGGDLEKAAVMRRHAALDKIEAAGDEVGEAAANGRFFYCAGCSRRISGAESSYSTFSEMPGKFHSVECLNKLKRKQLAGK